MAGKARGHARTREAGRIGSTNPLAIVRVGGRWGKGRSAKGRLDESSSESVFLRPTTNHTASTVSSPIVANRCGCVQSNEIVSPGPIS